ncbi:hypothetical protein CYY_008418 [Polysphondylium violaceum]|uniref:Uncharacterized protein n=1 Tax=Polysphondylium violaceum TaxID=133409 RepID=A0A8J4PV95_9MYCE|nr:hypothetical protein CYY_008418 [Polysphondylium violaceum]
MNNELFFRVFQNQVLRKHIFCVCKDDYLNDCLAYHKKPFDMFTYPILKICQERNLKLLEYRFQLFYDNTRLKLPSCYRFYSFHIDEDSLMALFSWPNFPLSLFKRIYKELSEHMNQIIEKKDIISSLSKGNNYEIYQYLLKKRLSPPIAYSPGIGESICELRSVDFLKLFFNDLKFKSSLPKHLCKMNSNNDADFLYYIKEQLLSDRNQQLLHNTILNALEIDNIALVEYFIPQSKLLNFKLWNDEKHPPQSHIPLFGIDFVADEKNQNNDYTQLIHQLIKALLNSKHLDLIQTMVLAFPLKVKQKIYSLNIVCKSLEIFKWLDNHNPFFNFNLVECMVWACKANDKPYVEFLVRKTKSAETFDSYPPLESNYEIIRYLIQQKASKNICFKETCLLDLEFIKYLDSQEPNFNVPLYSSRRVLIEAANRDDIEIVRYILETKGTVLSLGSLELNSEKVKVLNYLYQSSFLGLTDLSSLSLTSLIKDRWTLAGLDPSVKRFLQRFLFFLNKTDPEYDGNYDDYSFSKLPLHKILELVQFSSRSLYKKYQPQFLQIMKHLDFLFQNKFYQVERQNRDLIINNLDTQDYSLFDFILQRGVFDSGKISKKDLLPVFIQIIQISFSKKKYNILAYLYLSQCYEFHPYLDERCFSKNMTKYFEHYIPPQEEIKCKNKAKEYCSFLYFNTIKQVLESDKSIDVEIF